VGSIGAADPAARNRPRREADDLPVAAHLLAGNDPPAGHLQAGRRV
jgi:hypothetical protein